MTIEKNSAVEVLQVDNGYLVKRPYMLSRNTMHPIEESLVFQSFAGLVEWLRGHFSHRDALVERDCIE